MRTVKHLEAVDYRDKFGQTRKGNILSFHWNRFKGTTFRLINDSDRIALVHQSDITWMEMGEW